MKPRELLSMTMLLAGFNLLVCCGTGARGRLSDTPLPPWPTLPTLNDPLLYPQSGIQVPDAVEFQFNPTLRSVDSIRIVESSGGDEGELLNGETIEIATRGVCFRFAADGVKVVEVSGINHMGAAIKGRVVFQVQGVGANVKTCMPWSGGRTFSRDNPLWVPSVPGGGLPGVVDGPGSGPWSFPVEADGKTWSSEWMNYTASVVERHASELLETPGLPMGDISKLCPGFSVATRGQKTAFWTLFVASIAYPESGFNPRSRFLEPPPLSKWSEGLLQLSTDDYVSHGDFCDFMSEPDRILSPRENIRCGVMILRNQIRQRGTLWPSTFYYWSVLTTRKSAVVRRVFRENAAKHLGFCGI
jgi:hypothetical protein